jgi:hypothetical protein
MLARDPGQPEVALVIVRCAHNYTLERDPSTLVGVTRMGKRSFPEIPGNRRLPR